MFWSEKRQVRFLNSVLKPGPDPEFWNAAHDKQFTSMRWELDCEPHQSCGITLACRAGGPLEIRKKGFGRVLDLQPETTARESALRLCRRTLGPPRGHSAILGRFTEALRVLYRNFILSCYSLNTVGTKSPTKY